MEDVASARDCSRGPDDLVVELSQEVIEIYFDQKESENKSKLEKVMKIAELQKIMESNKKEFEISQILLATQVEELLYSL